MYWWKAGDADGNVFRERFWESVDTFTDINSRRYPLDLDVGSSAQAITNELVRDLYRNLVVSMLVRAATAEPGEFTTNPSGFAAEVARPSPEHSRHVRVAFGANQIHEFSHAFGLLSDEYINGRGTPPPGTSNTRVDPGTPSVFSLSNLRYSNRIDDVPWIHLSPGGWQGRTASGQDPSPLVGWLWVGGSSISGVARRVPMPDERRVTTTSQFTQVTDQDPTANADGTYSDENGADLRDRDRFCLWCQEIVTLRILEKTDQLSKPATPPTPRARA